MRAEGLSSGDERPTAGFSLFFTNASSLMSKSVRRRLEPDDLLASPDEHVDISAQFEALWQKEQARAEADKAAHAANPPKPPKKGKKPKGPRPANIRAAILPLIKSLWLPAAVLFLLQGLLGFVGPIIIGQMTRMIETVETCARAESTRLTNVTPEFVNSIPEACRFPYVYWGYSLAAILVVAKLLESLFLTHSQYLMMRIALRARSVLIGQIYRKCLRLAGIGDSNTGQIQNLMANDAQFFVMLAPMFNSVWLAPLQIIITFIWLGLLIGPAFLAGLGVMFITVSASRMHADCLPH